MLLLRSLTYQKKHSQNGFPFDLPLIQNFEHLDFTAPVTFFVGDNGSGKSTLIEAIAQAAQLRLVGQQQFQKAPFGTEIFNFSQTLKLVWNKKARNGFFMSAESFFEYVLNMNQIKRDNLEELKRVETDYKNRSAYAKELAGSPYQGGLAAMRRDYGEGLETVSHGEGFLTFFQKRFVGEGLYLLDEPEAPLSPIRQLTMLAMIHEMVHQGGQFIIATHSPILMAYPGAEIYHLNDTSIKTCAWEDLENVQVMKDFLNHPQLVLKELLK